VLRSPRISLVTTSFNRRTYLRAALDSVLTQGYQNLEYVVVDGGSTDGSAEIVRQYADRLAWWISEPDGGQYEGINKGFQHTSGEVMGWLNSDDLHLPWTLSVVGELFATFPQIEWLTTSFPLAWNERGEPTACQYRAAYGRAALKRGEYLSGGAWYSTGFIQQESTFWRRSLWERRGAALDTHYRVAADFDLWMRFGATAELYSVDVPLAGFRVHGDQVTATAADLYVREATESLAKHGGRPYSRVESALQRFLISRLPDRARRWATRAGIVEPRFACVHGGRDGGWQIRER
jgi:glycosyltransferase involved in cell wall biosynthesis